MPTWYDIAYGIGVGIASPFWLLYPRARRKVLGAFRERSGHVDARDSDRPAVMIHAVSLGEMNATRSLVTMLSASRPDLQFVIASTTDTGFARGQELYRSNPDIRVVRYPIDFSGAVNRVLDAAKPSLVVLMELEVWPNFVRACAQRDIPVILVNGRLTSPSFRRYKRIGFLTRGMFESLAMVCAQDRVYGERFADLGVLAHRVRITGTMKFDTAAPHSTVHGSVTLAKEVGLVPGKEPIWVCGSTGPGEEQILLKTYRDMLLRFPRLRLVIVPRKPERFDEVAEIIRASKFDVVRRSRPQDPMPDGPLPPVVLGDTMGELRKFYALATIVFVGRSLVDLGPRQHGSDMIEPAALARPVIVGPFTGNFLDVMRRFIESDAVMVAADGNALAQGISVLLSTPSEATMLGQRAQVVVANGQGATRRNVDVILALLAPISNQEKEKILPPMGHR